jgi:hypothetical protein
VAKPTALLLDKTARRYGTRPSILLGLTDPIAALDLDVALADYGQQETWRHVREASRDEPDWFVSMLLLVMDLV